MAVFTEEIVLEDGVTDVAEEAQSAVRSLADAMGGLSGSTSGIADSMGGLASASGTATDATGGLADSMGGATESGAGMQAELAEMTGGLSIVAEAAGVAALAIGEIILAGSAMAIKFTETTNKTRAMFDALGHGKISGDQTIKMLDDLGNSTGLTREKLAPLAQSFMAMGITGTDQLKKLTLAAASADATIAGSGDTFTNTFKKLTAAADLGQPFKVAAKGAGSLLSMGLDIDDMAKRMGMSATQLGAKLKVGLDPATARKFGDAMQDALIKQGAGPLATLGSSFESIKAKFMENVGKMFADAGPAVDEFMAAVKDLFSIFDSGEASGKAMGASVGGFFKSLFTTAAKVVPYIKHFLLDMIIQGQLVYLRMIPIIKKFQELWKMHDGLGLLKKALITIGVVLAAVAVAVLVLLAPMIVGGIIIAAIIVGVIALGVAMQELAAKIAGGLVAAFVAIKTWVSSAIGALGEWVSSAADTAKNFIAGLVGGITNGAGAVVGAVKGLAKGAMDSITGALGIKSPSTVMMGFGQHTTALRQASTRAPVASRRALPASPRQPSRASQALLAPTVRPARAAAMARRDRAAGVRAAAAST